MLLLTASSQGRPSERRPSSAEDAGVGQDSLQSPTLERHPPAVEIAAEDPAENDVGVEDLAENELGVALLAEEPLTLEARHSRLAAAPGSPPGASSPAGAVAHSPAGVKARNPRYFP